MGLKKIMYIIFVIIFYVSLAQALTIETKKGDVIKGNIGMEKLRVQPDFGGVIEIPVREIISLLGEDNKNVFKLNDGTTIRGKIADEKIIIKTKFGEIGVPAAEIKKITLEAAKLAEEKTEAKPAKEDRKFSIKKEIGKGSYFLYTMEEIEIKGKNIIFYIGYKNTLNIIASIKIDKNYKATTALLNEEGIEYNLISLTGITTEETQVNPQAKKIATFTFPLPKELKKGKLVTCFEERAVWHYYYNFVGDFEIPQK